MAAPDPTNDPGRRSPLARLSSAHKVLLAVLAWTAVVSLLHLGLNLHGPHFGHSGTKTTARTGPAFHVGFIPVTCHLTCPVTHFINQNMTGESSFEPVRFNGWPELKEAFLSDYLEATFMLAPLAMALREQGVPLKIVYLGHRDGTTMMVHRDSAIHRIEDLRGKSIAIPNRFSNQHLIVFRALKQRGMNEKDVSLVEMPPPDMPAALQTHAVDAVISGEPFMAQAEMEGFGRILFLTKDVWPNFISCVLAVSARAIRERRPEVQGLVDGIARSGKWLDQTMDHRMQAADYAGKDYYHQDPALLRFVLSKPPDRVKYTNLMVLRKDFEEIEALGTESGVLRGTARFDDYADTSFVRDEAGIKPYQWEAPR